MRKTTALYKKIKNSVRLHNNERGFIMGVVIMLSLILLIIVTMAIWSTTNESRIVRNTGAITQEFYNAESGIVGAMNHSNLWLTNEFVSGNHNTSYVKMNIFDDGSVLIYESEPEITNKGNGPATVGAQQIAEVQIRHIDSYGADGKPVRITDGGNFVLWEKADEYPNMPHVGNPSGGSAKLEGHYYSITSMDINDNSIIQIGVIQDFVRP